jgi:mono/diheme cytochrome c family protein
MTVSPKQSFVRRSSAILRSRAATLLLGGVVAASALLGAACSSEPHPFKEGRTFAGNSEAPEGIAVDAHALNDGYDAYMQYCRACHGDKGDGKGPASYGLRPPPRDFTKGIFKFARVSSSDELPHDDDLIRIVKGGLHGTAMLPWDIPKEELHKIIHYIKTFAPQKFEKKKKSGDLVKTLDPFELPEDPWAGKEAEAVVLGKELYHLRAECMNCHPGYGTKKEIYELSVAANKKNPEKFSVTKGFREDVHGSVAKDSPEYAVKILPPDFLFHPVRSTSDPKNVAGDLFRLISYGVYPIMPKWKDSGLTDSDIWALAHYVKSLMDMKDTPAAAKFKAEIAAQPAFEIPAPAPPPEEKPAEPTEKDGEGDNKEGDKKDGDKKDADKKDADKKPGDKKKAADKKAADKKPADP